MSETKAKKRKYEHWSKFTKITPSMRKASQRVAQGVCIGCGKNPCECKKPRSSRK